MRADENAILKTLSYHDIFDFPLKKEELEYLLIEKENKNLNLALANLLGRKIEKKNGFYFLKGREEIVTTRKKRETASRKKLALARRISRIISFIPSLKLIGVSGGLSLMNSDVDDDIDLFVVTDERSVWTSRFIILLVLEILGKRKKRKGKPRKDEVCLNMIISESKLGKLDVNLYVAHEIAQLRPLFERDGVYKKLINENIWMKKYLPNFSGRKIFRETKSGSLDILLSFLLSLFEPFFYIIQFQYMRGHKTREKIEKDFAAFHPIDYEKKILKKYSVKIKNV